MKIIALKTEAGLKRLVSDLAGLEASEIELLTLEEVVSQFEFCQPNPVSKVSQDG